MGFGDFLKKAGGIVGGVIGGIVAGPPGAAAGFAIGGTAGSTLLGMDAADEEKKAAEAQRKAQKLMQWQEAMQSLRMYQMASAGSGVAWESSGASLESSGAQGSRSAIGSQAAFNLNMRSLGSTLADKYYGHLREATNLRGDAAMAQAIGNIGSAAMSFVPVGGTVPPPTTQQIATQAQYNPPASVPGVNYGQNTLPWPP